MQPDQRARALEKANAVRHNRAELKRAIKAGEARFVDLLSRAPSRDPEWLRQARIYDLAMAVPGVGRKKLRRAFRKAKLPEATTFGLATPQTRQRLLDGLRVVAPKAFA